MRHQEITSEVLEDLSLLALDALESDTARRLRQHVDECPLCGNELRRLRDGLAMLPHALAAGRPSPGVRESLMGRVRASRRPGIDFEALEWKATGLKGVSRHVLREDTAIDYSMTLLKMRSGSRLPDHQHDGAEDCLVLKGRMRDAKGVYGPGGFVHYGPGTDHRGVECLGDDECILLIVSGGMTLLPSRPHA